mmetsp:Transcript_36060/g.52855  ORF Transcript_36060/g.52855 Transcript_36060/m.52855 type:complete len:167 (+) Transcript_36060:809-1309(+)
MSVEVGLSERENMEENTESNSSNRPSIVRLILSFTEQHRNADETVSRASFVLEQVPDTSETSTEERVETASSRGTSLQPFSQSNESLSESNSNAAVGRNASRPNLRGADSNFNLSTILQRLSSSFRNGDSTLGISELSVRPALATAVIKKLQVFASLCILSHRSYK